MNTLALILYDIKHWNNIFHWLKKTISNGIVFDKNCQTKFSHDVMKDLTRKTYFFSKLYKFGIGSLSNSFDILEDEYDDSEFKHVARMWKGCVQC